MLPGSPTLWLVILLSLSGPVTYGVMKLKTTWQLQAVYNEGKQAGMATNAAAAVSAATKTAEAIREAEAETPLPADKQAVIDLCKRSASCRERSTLK